MTGRGPADAVLALALIHHLAIAKNIPLDKIAGWLTGLAPSGVVEFVPKEDRMVRKLPALRPDIFPDYDIGHFLDCPRARIERIEKVNGRQLIWFRSPQA